MLIQPEFIISIINFICLGCTHLYLTITSGIRLNWVWFNGINPPVV